MHTPPKSFHPSVEKPAHKWGKEKPRGICESRNKHTEHNKKT